MTPEVVVALVKARPSGSDYVIRCTAHGIVRIPPGNMPDRQREAHIRAAARAPAATTQEDRYGGSGAGWYKGSRKACLPVAFLHAIEHDVELTEVDGYIAWAEIEKAHGIE